MEKLKYIVIQNTAYMMPTMFLSLGVNGGVPCWGLPVNKLISGVIFVHPSR